MGRTESGADDAVHPGASFAGRLLVGFAAGLVGGAAMNAYSRAMNCGRGRREATETWNDGCPPHGAQPPQAEGAAENDATVRVGAAIHQALTGRVPDRVMRSTLGTLVHYAFSATLGANYALLAERLPVVRAAHGVAYGTAVWILADELAMPLLGLSRGPRRLPARVHLYALAGHWVYGVALDTCLQAGRGRRTAPLSGA